MILISVKVTIEELWWNSTAFKYAVWFGSPFPLSAFVRIWVTPWVNPSPPRADVICKWPLLTWGQRVILNTPRDCRASPQHISINFFQFFFLGAHTCTLYVTTMQSWALPCVPDGTQKTCGISWWWSLNAGSHNSCSAQQRCWVELHTTTSCVASKTCSTQIHGAKCTDALHQERKSRKSERAERLSGSYSRLWLMIVNYVKHMKECMHRNRGN